MLSFTIIPSLGIKDDVLPDDPTMFEFITESIARSHCADSRYVTESYDYKSKRGTATKTGGRTVLMSTDAAVSSGTLSVCGLTQFRHDGKYIRVANYLAVTNHVDEGLIYCWTSSGQTPFILSNGAGAQNLIYKDTLPICNPCQYGDHMIFPVNAYDTPPYCTRAGSALLEYLEIAGSRENFRYIEGFKNRLFGACTLSSPYASNIKYSNLNPTLPDHDIAAINTTVDFSQGNIFYPNLGTITGIRSFRDDRLFVFSTDTIAEIKYLANYSSPFSIEIVVTGFGALSHDSIVVAPSAIFFYDYYSQGFCVFDGLNVQIISGKIQKTVESIIPIASSVYPEYNIYTMQGALHERTNEVAWTVSTNGSYNTAILYYNYITGNWRRDPHQMRCIAPGLLTDTGYKRYLLMANSNVVYYGGQAETDAGGSYTAYREEPILNFGGMNKSLLLEMWFNYARSLSSGSIKIYYRGADTVGEVLAASWTLISTLTPTTNDREIARPVNGVNVNNRYHQIKWGSEASADLFSIREIKFNYVMQGMY